MSASHTFVDDPDVILIGSGIMSANLGVMLKCLEPRMKIQVFEITDELAQEASHGRNNAGTGHAGICELSYTPSREADGSVNISRALHIFEQFEHSKQFWGHVVASGIVPKPSDFIRAVPHIGFVHGEENVDFLRARFQAMAQHHFFQSMEYTNDWRGIADWAPLVMEGRDSEPVAATKMDSGTEVDFGELARRMLRWLAQQEGCGLATGHRVSSLSKAGDVWHVDASHLASGEQRVHRAKFVFIGAGGGSLPLLQSTGLPEVRGLGGFPIGGHWLVCSKPEIVSRHNAKVYGMVPKASPSLGAPHLDIRGLGGEKTLLFGPFATWTGKFLKHTGSHADLLLSLRSHNLGTLVRTGLHNLDLVRYCMSQGLQSVEDRVAAVREFYPSARTTDWQLVDAGVRVQALKKADQGAVYFGTEVFTDANSSVAALLGASPGASVSVNIAREVILKCFPQLLARSECRARMKEMLPTYDEDLKQTGNAGLFEKTTRKATESLQIQSNP
ncbi:MAG: malate dehydrogenase (quinone) [Verrucomicrobiota bacterium]